MDEEKQEKNLGDDIDIETGDFKKPEKQDKYEQELQPTTDAPPNPSAWLISSEEEDPRVTRTWEVLQAKLPEKNINLFSNEGSTAVIYEISEKDSKVLYKVGTKIEYSDCFTEEAKKLKLLASTGAGPKLIGFYPVREKEDSEKIDEAPNRSKNITPLDDVQIPLLEDSELPIIVMEKIDIDSKRLVTLSKLEIESKARELAHLASDSKLIPRDSEVVLEAETGKLKIIDAGGCHYDENTNPEIVYHEIIDILMDWPAIRRKF